MRLRLNLRRSRGLGSMASRSSEEKYRVAISTLNGLQTNASTLEQIRRHGDDRRVTEYNRMQQYMERVGIAPSDLQQLNAVHVSGTKGKGSVCAMVESILRHHGLNTGLYVSPHLLEVRERIRIHGQPLSRDTFVSHFWDVYSKLHNTRHLYDNSMPSYFRFLTVMAFSVFLDSKVDVAVVEVGIGGTHDSTNIIEQPVVCGITSLGYDHTDILGPTLSDIAWHKGGICKEHRPAFTVEQAPEALAALHQRAAELEAHSLSVVPPLSSYPGPTPVLGLRGRHQTCNASLAVQLCSSWLKNHSCARETDHSTTTAVHSVPPFALTETFQDGLRLCRWAGRNQVVVRGRVTYYLDGAHTPGSVEGCGEWFISELASNNQQGALRVLIFNTTGNRDSEILLQPLMECGFNRVVFCPNISHSSLSPNSPDHTSRMVTNSSQLKRCYANQQCLVAITGQEKSERSRVCVSVSDAVEYVDSFSSVQVAVLVTGSLHLVGTVMGVLAFTVDDL